MAEPVVAEPPGEPAPSGKGKDAEGNGSMPTSRWGRFFDYLSWGVLIVVGLHLLTRETGGPQLNSKAPPHTLVRLSDGESITLPEDDHQGPILIKAFASWCGACKRSVWIEDLADLKNSGDLKFVAVSVDEHIENAQEAASSWPIVGEVLFDRDGSFSRDYDIQVLPTYILLDKNHKVSRVTSGLPGPLDIRSWKQATDRQ